MTELETTSDPLHLTPAELEAGLDEIREAPKDGGRVQLIMRRPQEGERELVETAELDTEVGVVGDRWSHGRSGGRPRNPATQVTLMSARAAALVARTRDRWPLAGDQLYVDLDISEENLPPGTRLSLGSAVLEISREPHTGCKKFVSRFGMDAMLFVNSPVGRALRLRGVNARVVEPGTVSVGDAVTKLAA
jgi:MOSC domain-containing protein YiiM